MNRYAALLAISTLLVFSCSKPSYNPAPTEKSIKHIRGTNITCTEHTHLSKGDLQVWKDWGINTVRVNFDKDDEVNVLLDAPQGDIWKPYKVKKGILETWLNWMNDLDMQVIISLDILWGDDHNSDIIWASGGNNEYLNHRIELFKEMQVWLQYFECVKYIEVWNEPYPYNEIYKTYFLPQIVQVLESIDNPIEIIVMAPYDWGDMKGFVNWPGLQSEDVTYSTHIYDPYMYTHQLLYDLPEDTAGWPGWHKSYTPDEEPVYMDIALVREFLKTITDFEEQSGKKVIITEFGVLRWAKDNDKYISDLITVFEENELQWIFHSMAGWNGWNPTYAADRSMDILDTFGGDDTKALQVLKDFWQLNLEK